MKFLIQNMTRRINNASKTEYFQKVWSNFSFLNENIFFRNKFSKNAQKSQHWRFTVYIDQLNCSLRASFPKNLDFLKTVCSSKFYAWLKSWPNFWRYVDNQFTLWHEVFFIFLLKAWGVAKKLLTFLFKIGRVLKACFKIWQAVKSLFPKMTS